MPEGRLGRGAYEFVDWLAGAGQSWWQVLPLGPPDRYRSPYKSRSAFAAWPRLLESPRALVRACEISEFRERHAFWIGDWERFAGRGAVEGQVRFEREWGALRAYAAAAGVRLFGDVAIYVSPGSVDHVSHPELFQAGLVGGAPPDAFSRTGQLWGNPLYDWPAMRRRRYHWWVERMRRSFELFDLARIDHFRGFVSYWAVPAGARTAAAGRWKRGPGRPVFDAMRGALGSDLRLIAEDLGVITPAVTRLRDQLGLPGMAVIQFAFDEEDPGNPHRFENQVPNQVVYTGTHDHDTARGWYESLDEARRSAVDAEFSLRAVVDREPWWSLIRLAMKSPARMAMVQAQDVLGLGSEARMNHPSRARGSWRWQLEPGALTPGLGERLREASLEGRRVA